MLKIVKLSGHHFGLWEMSKWSGYFKYAFDIGNYRILWVVDKQAIINRDQMIKNFLKDGKSQNE